MKDKNLSKVLLSVYGLFGIGTGLIFGRSQYHKGQADAYDKIAKDLEETIQNVEEELKGKEEA